MTELPEPVPDQSRDRAAPFAALAGVMIASILLVAAASRDTSDHSRDPDFRIPVNDATAADMELLPGMGPPTSTSFVRERDRAGMGDMESADDLIRIRGIGPKIAKRMGPYVTFD